MGILIFQIVIFFLIVYSGYKGMGYLVVVTVIAVIFTLAMVNTNGLLVIQFFTIVVSFLFAINRIQANTNENSIVQKPQPKTRIEILLRILLNIGICCGIVIMAYYYNINFWNMFDDAGTLLFGMISYLILMGIGVFIFWVLISRNIRLITELSKT